MTDQTPLGRCIFPWQHRWTRWTQWERKVVNPLNGQTADAGELRQKRTCIRCGKMQDELVREG